MDLISETIEMLNKSITITIFVLSMMILIDWLNILTGGRIKKISMKKRNRQYVISSFLGSMPGCLGTFMSVSMYIHGIITFGALTACMIATSGDEAFVMLALFPLDALKLFALLFLIGVVAGYVVDKLIKKFNIRVCEECKIQLYHEEVKEKIISRHLEFSTLKILMIIAVIFLIAINEFVIGTEEIVERILFLSTSLFIVIVSIFSSNHYFNDHIVNHMLKNHVWKIFLWTFGALIFVNIGEGLFNLAEFIQSNMNVVLLLSALIGIIPESGPHMIFVTMYHKNMIPFSVLLTSSIVQDGHGMLPLLSYTIKDSVLVKIINVAVGLIIGYALFILGS